jgi:phospholipid/cholesterol/gamma-HCH transport system substrate-binding protein
MKDDTRNYIIVGVFVLAMIAGLVVWIALLSGRTGPTDAYYVRFENVLGLSSGTQIYFEGYPVGLIEGISPVDGGGGRGYRVDVSVRRGWKIPEDSIATITASGLLSAILIDIQAGTSETYLEPGDQIPSTEAANLLAMVGKVGDLVQNVKPILDTLSEGAPTILGNVETFTAELNQTLDRIRELMRPENTDRIARILLDVETTSNNIARASNALRTTQGRLDDLLATVGTLLDEDQGDVGIALTDLQHTLESVARHIDAITRNLEGMTHNMNEFSRQIREDPGLIIRGRSSRDEPEGAS